MLTPIAAVCPARRRAIFTAIALAIVTPPLTAAETSSANTEQTVAFAIPAKPLDEAINDFITVSDWQVGFPAALAQGVRSSGVSGRYTPTQALQKLLADTGISARATAGGAVMLAKTDVAEHSSSAAQAGATVLPVVTVTGKTGYDPNDPYNKEYAASSAHSATKTDTPIMETPMSIQVVPHTVMDDQQVIELKDAVRNVSGVQRSASQGDEGGLYDNFVIRGFDLFAEGIFRNGIRQAAWSSDVANLERIEVLKGPAAILYGRLEPGGMINLVTKKPQRESYYSLQQQIGSFDRYRTTLDATGSLSGDDTLLYRLNIAYLDKNSFRDFNSKERIMVAPSLTWNISDRTQINLGLEFQNDDLRGSDPMPAIGNKPANIPISRYLSDKQAKDSQQRKVVELDWSHAFNDDWKIKQRFQAQLADYDQTEFGGYFNGPAEEAKGDMSRFLWRALQQRDTYGTNIDLTGKFDTFGIKHNVLLGYDYYRFNQAATGNCCPDVAPINIYKPVYGIVDVSHIIGPASYNFVYLLNQDWHGFYFQDQMKLLDNLHFLAGGRHDWASISSIWSDDPSFAVAEAALKNGDQTRNAARFSPRLGLVYQPLPWLSLYGNYVESIGANNSGRSVDNKPFAPETAYQYEVGLKTEWFDGRLMSTLALYDIHKVNVLTSHSDPVLAAKGFKQTIGGARSQGVEFDLTGRVTDNISLIVNYAFNDTRITKDYAGLLGNRLPNAPAHSANFWGKYEFTEGVLNGFSLGSGVYVTSFRQGDSSNSFQLPGYARWDLAAAYKWTVGPTRMTTRFNVYNLLDKRYSESANTLDGNPRIGIAPGAPLTFMGSVQVEY